MPRQSYVLFIILLLERHRELSALLWKYFVKETLT
jgi:hypothetical protein